MVIPRELYVPPAVLSGSDLQVRKQETIVRTEIPARNISAGISEATLLAQTPASRSPS